MRSRLSVVCLAVGLSACGDTADSGEDADTTDDTSEVADGDADATDDSDAPPLDGADTREDLVISTAVTHDVPVLANNVIVEAGGVLTTTAGLDIDGDLIVHTGGEVRISGAEMRIGGNIVNDGIVFDLVGIRFSGRDGAPQTHQQTVTRPTGRGRFANALTAPTENFTALAFNNTTPGIAVQIENGDGVFVSKHVEFEAGIVDVGIATAFIFRAGATVGRTAGGLLRGANPDEGAQMAKLFAPGPASFVFHIYDNVGDFEYSPLTYTQSASDGEGSLAVSVFDRPHPRVTEGGTPASQLTRYWRVVGRPDVQVEGSLKVEFQAGDVVGSEPLHFSHWNGTTWTQHASTANGRTLTLAIDETTLATGNVTHITGRTR